MKKIRINEDKGFTILELLTVIAIIGMLASILYPVVASMRERAKMSHCMSNLREIAAGLQQYRLDEECYPEHLIYQDNGKWQGLFPYISSLERFHCPDNPFKQPDTPTDSLPSNAFVTGDFLQPDGTIVSQSLPLFDSYDGAVEGAADYSDSSISGGTYVAHYSLTRIQKASKPFPLDYSRQLRFSKPPDDTVVTWCTFHRKMPALSPEDSSQDIFLWLDGHVAKESCSQTLSIIEKHIGREGLESDWWRVLPENK